MKTRLDAELVRRGLVSSRSQAESWVKLGKVTVDGKPATKSGQFVREDSDIQLTATEKYVSRAGLKLASVAELLNVSFKNASTKQGSSWLTTKFVIPVRDNFVAVCSSLFSF